MKHEDTVRHAHDELHGVLDQCDGHPAGGDLPDQLLDLLGLDVVAAGGWFVEKQEIGLGGQCAGELEPLQRAVGKGRSGTVGMLGETDESEQLAPFGRGRAVLPRDRREREKMRERVLLLMQMPPNHDVLERRHVHEDLEVLKRARQAARRQFVGRQARYVLPIEIDAAAARSIEAGDHVEQGGLAGAVWADNRVDSTARDIERQVVDGAEAAEIDAQTFDLEECHVTGSAEPGAEVPATPLRASGSWSPS